MALTKISHFESDNHSTDIFDDMTTRMGQKGHHLPEVRLPLAKDD